jgi:hypothetical protein
MLFFLAMMLSTSLWETCLIMLAMWLVAVNIILRSEETIHWPWIAKLPLCILAACLVCVLGAKTVREQRNRESDATMGTVVAFMGETARIPMTEIKIKEPTDFEIQSVLRTTVPKLPKHELRLHSGENSAVVNVIVRNTSDAVIKLAEITVISNLKITGKTLGVVPFDDKQLGYRVIRMNPYARLGEEHFFSLQVETPNCSNRFYAMVLVDAENMEKYSAIAYIEILKEAPCENGNSS